MEINKGKYLRTLVLFCLLPVHFNRGESRGCYSGSEYFLKDSRPPLNKQEKA